MNKKKLEKYFYQRWYFWIVLVTLFLLTGLLFLIKDTITLSNILAFLSGWMGVLATIFIGVIATRQNKKYKEDNDEYIKKQDELMIKQYNFDIFKQIMDNRYTYISMIKKELNDFCEEYDFKRFSSKLAAFLAYKKEGRIEELYLLKDSMFVRFTEIYQKIKYDWFYTETNEKLCNDFDDYFSTLQREIEKLDFKKNIFNQIAVLNNALQIKYINLIKSKNDYIALIDYDYNEVLLNHSNDLEYIKNHYSYNKGEKNG